MDPEYLIGSIVKGMLAGRRKRGRRATRYLTGRRRGVGGGLFGPGALLTVAGLAWGAWETMQKSTVPTGMPGVPSGPTPPIPGSATQPGATTPPPLPGAAASTPRSGGAAVSAPPPVPLMGGSAASPNPGTEASGAAMPADLPPGVLQVIRLLVSAARADGSLGDDERAAILDHVRELGIERELADEMAAARPLREIIGEVTDPAARKQLYGLAFTVVRADEQVSGAERIYLAQLAHQLGLDPASTSQIEQEIAAQIDREPDEEPS